MPTQDLTDVGSMPRLGDVPARMHAQVIRPERYGDPQTRVRDRDRGDAAAGPGTGPRLRDGGGRQLQQRLGGARTAGRRHRRATQGGRSRELPHRRQRRLGHRLGGRRGSRQRSRRRPCGRALRRLGSRRPVDHRRRRPDHRAERADLGIRDQLGELCAVHARAGASTAPQIAAAQLGRGGRVHAGRRDRVSHALLVAAAHGSRE